MDARPQFGSRRLVNPDEVFKHNAWDNISWDHEQEEQARLKVQANSKVVLTLEEIENYENNADKHWNKFYSIHSNRFFKDRHWLFTEFPELAPDHTNAPIRVYSNTPTDTSVTKGIEALSICQTPSPLSVPSNSVNTNTEQKFFEIGCGVGNTIFPILEYNKDPNTFIYCCDFSPVAISLLKENPLYDSKRCHAFVLDGTDDVWNIPFKKNSIDIVILIFTLSSINPLKMKNVIEKAYSVLKKGGVLLFRDYGRYDLAQLRLKAGQCLSDNFYVRGDGTRVYFFTQKEITDLFTSVGFLEEQNLIDRRLQVNRGKQLTMYRVWIQAKYRK